MQIKTKPTIQVVAEMKIKTMGMMEEMKSPKYMLLSSDLAKAGTMLQSLAAGSLERFALRRDWKYIRKAAIPTMTAMLTMFEPKTLPTERAAPPDNAAISATVNSGSDVEKAIMLKPTAVLPKRVNVETLTALLMAILLAKFRTTKETAMMSMSMKNLYR